jgi:hypothetical protein
MQTSLCAPLIPCAGYAAAKFAVVQNLKKESAPKASIGGRKCGIA